MFYMLSLLESLTVKRNGLLLTKTETLLSSKPLGLIQILFFFGKSVQKL